MGGGLHLHWLGGLNELPEFAAEEVVDVCAMHFDPADYGEPQLEKGFL